MVPDRNDIVPSSKFNCALHRKMKVNESKHVEATVTRNCETSRKLKGRLNSVW